jgi:hypothetical protein
MRLARTPTVEDHLICDREIGMRGGHHGAGEVDARDHRPTANDGCLSRKRQAVLVVDGGMADTHENVAIHQICFA